MSDTIQGNADELAAAVSGVAGVEEIYPARPATDLLKQVVGTVLAKPTTPTLVHLAESSAGVPASVAIGVSTGEAATDVSRRVYETIEEYLTKTGDSAVAEIQVKVARIG